MNKSRRTRIARIQDALSDIIQEVNDIHDEEEESYYNLPDAIQDSTRGDTMSEAIDNLYEAISSLEEASSCLNAATE